MLSIWDLMVIGIIVWFFAMRVGRQIDKNSDKSDRLYAIFTELLNKKR